MGVEIERKFLVDVDKLTPHLEGSYSREYEQGYFSTLSQPVVRIRTVKGISRSSSDVAFITVKSENDGISREEYEYQIPFKDGSDMMNAFCEKTIKKTRHYINSDTDGKLWEVDFFKEGHTGLVIAEIELESVDEEVILPDWVTTEVSNDAQYYNSNLVKTSDIKFTETEEML